MPWADTLTDYDRAHLVTHLRVLDAFADNASCDVMVRRAVLGIDPDAEHARALRAIENHAMRAG